MSTKKVISVKTILNALKKAYFDEYIFPFTPKFL